jgi:hypothetical protein
LGFNAVVIAATYGSVSAVTFVTAVQYLENLSVVLHGGNMAAAMALMAVAHHLAVYGQRFTTAGQTSRQPGHGQWWGKLDSHSKGVHSVSEKNPA